MLEILRQRSLDKSRPLRPQITELLKNLIQNGSLKAGEQLPTTHELAELWETTSGNVHPAIVPLVKAGLLTRHKRHGTFVAERTPAGKIREVALYTSPGHLDESRHNFYTELLLQLRKSLEAKGYKTQTWTNDRQGEDLCLPLPRMLEAASARSFQAVIAICGCKELKWLEKLPVPVTFISGSRKPNTVYANNEEFVELGLELAAAQGCKSVGALLALADKSGGQPDEPLRKLLAEKSAKLGLECLSEWIVRPGGCLCEKDAERFGYDGLKSIWSRPKRPQALLVYTDLAAKGVLLALGQLGVKVPEELRLILHRNNEAGLFCPYPASFLDIRIAEFAEALITQIERQAREEKCPALNVRFHVEENKLPDA